MIRASCSDPPTGPSPRWHPHRVRGRHPVSRRSRHSTLPGNGRSVGSAADRGHRVVLLRHVALYAPGAIYGLDLRLEPDLSDSSDVQASRMASPARLRSRDWLPLTSNAHPGGGAALRAELSGPAPGSGSADGLPIG